MPRIQFRLASDSDGKRIDCFAFQIDDNGRPHCTALVHPFCLAACAKACPFKMSKRDYENYQGGSDGGKI
ncbi:MAG: hypothetical protein RR394_05260 [Oscillospiraceae bacterium]